MNFSPTSNTQAILLLTAPLIAGRSENSHNLLSQGEYNRLARLLRDGQRQPEDLIGPDAGSALDICSPPFDRSRLEALLARGFQLSQAADRWSARAIWVMSRADTAYPRRMRSRVREDAPPILYGCGDPALLETGGLAVVGSRHVDEEIIHYTENVGRLSADANRTLVSGGARGIDRAAMSGALEAGGRVVGVMADSLERAALARDNREPLMDGRLALVSPYDPAAGFNVGHAMQRNKLVYALADAAFVVNSDFEKGGTWAGAIEQLERLHFVPLFVRNGASAGKGNTALLNRGGKPWPNPRDSGELAEVFSMPVPAVIPEPTQEAIPFGPPASDLPQKASPENAFPEMNAEGEDKKELRRTVFISHAFADHSPADALLKAVQAILEPRLASPRSEAEIVQLLAVTKPQAKAWLSRLVEEGVLETLKKPVRYRIANSSQRLL